MGGEGGMEERGGGGMGERGRERSFVGCTLVSY